MKTGDATDAAIMAYAPARGAAILAASGDAGQRRL